MIPFPGTPFYDELHEKGFIKDGAPDYPDLTRDEMEKMAQKAYRSFYISLPFLISALKHPYELIFSRIKLYMKAIPAIFWKKYIR